MGPPIKKSKSLKALSKKVNVNVPCPYPPRIQRQWEAHNKKKWYGLSLDSKKRAETSMKELVLQNKQLTKKSKISSVTSKDKKFRF